MTPDATVPLAAFACFCWAGASLLRLADSTRSDPTLIWAGLGLLTAALVHRGDVSGHWPLTNPYEFTLVFAWSLALTVLWLENAHRSRLPGTYALPVAVVLLAYAVVGISETDQLPRPAQPVLRSIWLQLHVGSSALAYGAFGVAAALGVLYLAKERQPETDPAWIAQLDHTIYRAAALGFLWLTAGIFTGAIWAQTAWGDYWSWDPKEVWALLTWLTYLLYLHARALRGWQGRRVAWIAALGFGVVLFTFLGLGWLVRQLQVESLHVF